jgi:hypothetical protein
MSVPRTYRLAAPDRTGWFLGLDALQVAASTVGLLAGSLLAGRGAYAAALAVVLAGLGLAFTRVGGQPLHQVGAPWLAFVWRRAVGCHRWFAPLRGAGTEGPVLPKGIGAVDVTAVPAGLLARFAGDPEVAVVSDGKARRGAVTLRVSGRGFALADPVDQDRLCNGWGDALAACASGASPASAVQVTVRNTPDAAMPGATRREVLVTVIGQAPGRSRRPEALVAAAARFGDRLIAAGLTVDTVLDTAGWATLTREAFDPAGQASRAHTLGERAGVSRPAHAGPLAVEEQWGAVHIDATWHRAFLVADWPRLELPASWLAGLLLFDGPTWTLSVWLEPVQQRRARQAVERQAAKLTSDEEQRRRAGFRIGATHQRHHDDLEAHEAELVAGHAEYEYVGIMAVSAATAQDLDQETASLVATAAGCGIELRPLHGRHLAGLAATLVVPGALRRKENR